MAKPDSNPASPPERKRGNNFGFTFFRWMLRLLGMKHARRFAAVVCFYYLLFDWRAVRKTMPYANHLYPDKSFIWKLMFVYRVFHSQSCMLLDRASNLCGLSGFEHDYFGYDVFRHLAEDTDDGVILLGAHFGNWQLAVVGLKELKCRVNIVMNEEYNEAVKKHLELNSRQDNINYIFTGGPAHGAFEIAAALCNGEVVCMMGDRHYSADTVEIEFLGETAYFPASAFAIAARTGSPVISLFIYKDWKTERYSAYGSEPMLVKKPARGAAKESFVPWVKLYATQLERMIREYPEQGFLFYDVWKK